MPAENRPSTYRNWLWGFEIMGSILLLAAVVIIALSGSAVLNEVALWIGFFLPGVLGLAALVSSGFDVYLITKEKARLIEHNSRWVVIGKLIMAGVIGFLAIATVFFVIQTILIYTVIDTGGGVIFGPILWMVTGNALAVTILLRSGGEIVLIDDTPVFNEKSIQ